MIEKPHQALLPPGMVDLLPPEAEFEARTTEGGHKKGGGVSDACASLADCAAGLCPPYK